MPMLCMDVDIYISIQSGKLSKNKTRRKRKQKYYLNSHNLKFKIIAFDICQFQKKVILNRGHTSLFFQ